jgi:hypothetical protein
VFVQNLNQDEVENTHPHHLFNQAEREPSEAHLDTTAELSIFTKRPSSKRVGKDENETVATVGFDMSPHFEDISLPAPLPGPSTSESTKPTEKQFLSMMIAEPIP